MKYLYKQTLLVLILSSMISSWTFGQLGDPILVNVRNTGTSFTDQFSGDTSYAFGILQGVEPQMGNANILAGTSGNTLKVMFTPTQGVVGSTDFIVTYYSVGTQMHPVTRWYRFNVSNEVIIAAPDKFVIDKNAVDVSLDVLANDSITSGSLLVSKISVSNSGIASVNANGTGALFTPAVDFQGDVWLQYIACDTLGNCGEGTIHVLVRDPNVQDSVIHKKFLLNTEDLQLLTPFADFTPSLDPAHGTLNLEGGNSWTYTPDEGFVGKDTFELNMLNLMYRRYEVTVYEKNLNVHAKNDKFYVRPGLSVTFNVLNNDLIEYDIASHTNPAKGSLTSIGAGEFTYTPNVGYRGVDKFNYTTCFQDTVYCETATVYIHVTDLEPDNQFSYKLQTSKELPLAIDYPVDYTDFSYIISDNPDHGTLTFYTGLQQVNLPCDTVESYNMIVYEPSAGYTGADHFEYYYCIQPSNLCYLVKVDMDVVEHPETETCPCTVGCIWPGDADQNGRVDMGDLLSIGNKLGDSGFDRNYTDPSLWFGQHSQQWISGESNLPHLDANGDGTITADDVDAIDEFYYRTNDVVVRDVQQKLPYQFTIIPVQYSLDSGDVVILDIALGNATNPVIDLKGIKFSVNIPAFMMDSASVQVDFHPQSWIAEAAPFISLGKVPFDGRIDAGIARAQGSGATGYGVIATVVFIIEEDVEGFKSNNGIIEIPISLQAGTGMDNEGVMYDVEGSEIVLTYNPQSKPAAYQLAVYPNPATDLVNVHLNGKSSIQSIQIVDPQGRSIKTFDHIDQKHFAFDASSLPVGLYYLNVRHTEGSITELFSVIR